jgi:hypothetical protein
MFRLVPFLLGLVLLVTACSGGGSSAPSRADYEQAVVSARDDVDTALTNLGQGVKDNKDLADRLAQASLVVDRAADALDQAGAAKGFEDENATLVKDLHELARDVSGTAEQFRDPTFEDVFGHTQALQWESWTKANRILRSLQKQGIDVKPWA